MERERTIELKLLAVLQPDGSLALSGFEGPSWLRQSQFDRLAVQVRLRIAEEHGLREEREQVFA